MSEDGVFKPGDPVSVWSAYGSTVEKLAVVAKVSARKMVLSDNSEWITGGYRPWGTSAGFGNRTVRHRHEGDKLNCLRSHAHNALSAIKCNLLEEADLRTILEIARRSDRAKQPIAGATALETERRDG